MVAYYIADSMIRLLNLRGDLRPGLRHSRPKIRLKRNTLPPPKKKNITTATTTTKIARA